MKQKISYKNLEQFHKFFEGDPLSSIVATFTKSNYGLETKKRIQLANRRFQYHLRVNNVKGIDEENKFKIYKLIKEEITRQDLINNMSNQN